MEARYEKRWKVYEVSNDGLMKHPVKERAYYSYRETYLNDAYKSKDEAIADIIKYDVGDCIIVQSMQKVWS